MQAMSKISRRGIVVIISVLLIILLILFGIFNSRSDDKEKTKQISLIVYGSESDRWENLRQGAELACDEAGAELSLITMSSENNVDEQIDLVKREIENGVDGILLAPSDSNKLGDFIDENKINTKIVMVENDINSEKKHTCVSADNYEMGKALGETIVDKENPIVKVAIICDGLDGVYKESVEDRLTGVNDAIGDYVNKIVIWERDDSQKKLSRKAFLQNKLVEDAVDVIVALDNESADALMDALDNLNRTTKAYVISTSEKSVYYLDQEKIKALNYQTEFGIGYIGANYILDEKQAKKHFKEDGIEYQVVDKKSMYDYDMQTLIFPLVR